MYDNQVMRYIPYKSIVFIIIYFTTLHKLYRCKYLEIYFNYLMEEEEQSYG